MSISPKKYKDRAQFVGADLCRIPWPVPGLFDRAMAIGVLHHLPDSSVLKILKNARAVLKPGAKLITMDGYLEKGQSFIARMLLSMDRGKHVRTQEGYVSLARSVFGRVECHVETGMLRLPYSHLVMEMTSD